MKWIVLLGFLLFLPSFGFSQVLLNEVYYDHPGSDTGHEFIELIGVGVSGVNLAGVAIEFHDGASGNWRLIWSGSAGDTLWPDALFVLGGELVRPAPDDITTLSLQNGPDAVRLLQGGVVVDVLGYGDLSSPDAYEGEPAPDVGEGQSLARWPDGHDTGDNASDFRSDSPSPGFFNQPRRDLALLRDGSTPRRAVLAPGDHESLLFRIANAGIHRVDQGVWIVAIDSTHGGPVTIDSALVDVALEPEAGLLAAVMVAPGFGYHDITVGMCLVDERVGNNAVLLQRRIGGPRIIVSEVMSHPAAGCPEYIELFNDDAVGQLLTGFAFRDAVREPLVVETTHVVNPGEWVVLTPDALGLQRCFPGVRMDRVIETHGSWPSLNHSGSGEADSVIVLDHVLLPVDRVAYPGQPSSTRGRSLERIDLYYGIRAHTWALSDSPSGGTPGERNTRSVADHGDARGVTVDPNPFDPYNDERMIVAVSGDNAATVEATVFDMAGGRVASIGAARQLPFVFVWDGRADDGRLVAAGHYVLACVFDGHQVEKVVIACARRR